MTSKSKTAEEALYTLLADKIGSVDPSQVFFAKQIDSGKSAGKYDCLVGGKKVTPAQAANLKQEAQMLATTSLWKVFTETLRHEAQLRMFEKAKTTEDMNWGKAILHAVGIFETIVHSVENAHTE